MDPIKLNTPAGLLRRIEWRIRRMALGLSVKQFNEREFWREEIQQIVRWYTGELPSLYGRPSARKGPGAGQREILLFWHHYVAREWKGYLPRLEISEDSYRGLNVLEIGCGPMGGALCFNDCEIWGIDPLVDVYKSVGYPLDEYASRMHYVTAGAEVMPFPDRSFDAVFSVNAIDHVDDLPAAAREISRVLRPGGKLNLEAHYHAPTSCEPWALSDDVMQQYFGHLGLRKIADRPMADILLEAVRVDERMTAWSNWT